MNPTSTGAPDGAAPAPAPLSQDQPAVPAVQEHKPHDEVLHRPEPHHGNRMDFDLLTQVGWMLVIVVMLSEKAPLALIVLFATALVCAIKSRC